MIFNTLTSEAESAETSGVLVLAALSLDGLSSITVSGFSGVSPTQHELIAPIFAFLLWEIASGNRPLIFVLHNHNCKKGTFLIWPLQLLLCDFLNDPDSTCCYSSYQYYLSTNIFDYLRWYLLRQNLLCVSVFGSPNQCGQFSSQTKFLLKGKGPNYSLNGNHLQSCCNAIVFNKGLTAILALDQYNSEEKWAYWWLCSFIIFIVRFHTHTSSSYKCFVFYTV